MKKKIRSELWAVWQLSFEIIFNMVNLEIYSIWVDRFGRKLWNVSYPSVIII